MVIQTFYISYLSAHAIGSHEAIEAFPIEVDCFKYVISAIPKLSFEKIRAGVFEGPQIQQLLKDEYFNRTISEI